MREAKKKDGYSPSKVLYSTISDDISVDDGRERGGGAQLPYATTLYWTINHCLLNP